jgi:hypothetical protein
VDFHHQVIAHAGRTQKPQESSFLQRLKTTEPLPQRKGKYCQRSKKPGNFPAQAQQT